MTEKFLGFPAAAGFDKKGEAMPDRDEDRKRALIDAVVDALGGSGKSAKSMQNFARTLYSGAPLEDLSAYTEAELAKLAEDTFALAGTHRPGTTTVLVSNPDSPSEGGALERVTVVDVVNENMPFLLDSAMAELNERGLELRMVLHPVIDVSRDAKGKLKDVSGNWRTTENPVGGPESYIQIHVERIDSDLLRKDLAKALQHIFDDVRHCVEDWKPMLTHLDDAIREYRENPPPIPVEDIAEAVQFLEWLRDNNFTLLGTRQYDFIGSGEEARLERVGSGKAAGLGLLRDPNVKVLRRGREFVTYTPEIRAFLMQPVPLIVTKANVKSTVHRRVYLDYIGIKKFDDKGTLVGELRIIGLYTSTAYHKSVPSIPYVRRKAAQVMEMAGFDPSGHSGKGLQNVLDTFPRDELFQIDVETLYQFAIAIHNLSERPRIRVLSRADKFDRFVSVIVYVPRDRYNSEVRKKVGEYLADVYAGRISAYYPAFPEGTLARVHYIIGRSEGETPNPSQEELEARVGQIARTWSDALSDALASQHEPLEAQEISARYGAAFSVAYQETFPAAEAVDDIAIMDQLTPGHPLAIRFLPDVSGKAS
ncbi:MAG: NAD-glutamate dehydrogenase [Tepidamorphaceae bacterium]